MCTKCKTFIKCTSNKSDFLTYNGCLCMELMLVGRPNNLFLVELSNDQGVNQRTVVLHDSSQGDITLANVLKSRSDSLFCKAQKAVLSGGYQEMVELSLWRRH